MAANQERDLMDEAASLLLAARAGSLATLEGDAPHAALVTPAVAADGAIVLLLSDLSQHTRNLRANPACALLVTGAAADENPQTAPRLMLRGTAAISHKPEDGAAYLKFHPYAGFYAGFADFNFWRVICKEAHYVGGFAAASKLEIAALHQRIVWRSAPLQVDDGPAPAL